MALILLEGLDRTGKSTVAEYYKKQGYEVLHMSAPPKELSQPGYVGPSYLDQMVDIISQAATKDIVLDRTHYGELIWPFIYNRRPQLSEDDIEILREIEESVGVTRILMHDPNMEAHWKRCVDNKEPLNKGQFLQARSLYERMATKHGFEKKTIGDFQDVSTSDNDRPPAGEATNQHAGQAGNPVEGDRQVRDNAVNSKSAEQLKLEQANAINDILSKRILKTKGPIYDTLETDIRNFLREKMGRIFGEGTSSEFSKEEIQLLKVLCKRVKDKEKQ